MFAALNCQWLYICSTLNAHLQYVAVGKVSANWELVKGEREGKLILGNLVQLKISGTTCYFRRKSFATNPSTLTELPYRSICSSWMEHMPMPVISRGVALPWEKRKPSKLIIW